MRGINNVHQTRSNISVLHHVWLKYALPDIYGNWKKRNFNFLAREDIKKKKQCIMIEELIKDSLGLHFPFLNPPKFYRSICFRAVH